MAEKTMNTRILLKYDTYENWMTNKPVLKAGEIAIATIATGNTQEVNSVATPQVLIKVGDGITTYDLLPFVSARAADVYSWAKASVKPTYEATEITGIGEYIAQYVDETLGISVDTDTQYQIVRSNDYKYILQSRAKGTDAWADVSTIVIPSYDDKDVREDIDALEELVGTTAVATQITDALATYALKSELPTKVSELTTDTGYLVASDISGKVDKVDGKGLSTNDFTNDYVSMVNSAYTHAVRSDHVYGIQVNGTAQTNNNGTVNIAVPTNVSQLTNDSKYLVAADIAGKADKAATLAGYGIEDAYTKDAVDSLIGTQSERTGALEERVVGVEADIETLNGTGAGSVKKTVDDAINAFATNVSNDDVVNTYKELIDYAAEHGAEFTELVGVVDENTQAIATLNGSGTGSIAKAISDALTPVEQEVAKKADDSSLAAIAKTGNVNDLVQTTGDVLIFNCGDSTNCGA